jgi:hypothetical protein
VTASSGNGSRFSGVGSPDHDQLNATLAAIETLNVVAEQFSPRRLVLPNDTPTAQMVRGLGATEISSAPPPPDFLESVRRNLVAASHSGQFPPRDLRYAPWLLWNGDPPVATILGLLPQLLQQASSPGKTLHRLIEVYLRDFDPQASGLKEVAAKIREELTKGGPRLDTWRTAQNEVHLFEPERGPAALADRLLEAGQQPDEMLARYKFDDPLIATGKYMLAAEDAVRARAPQLMRKSGTTGLKRVLQILAPAEALRFKSHAAETGRALLRVWLDEGPEPDPALQEPARRILLHWLGDPRLRPQRWVAVGEHETTLMRRWLARASLDLFFGLIDDYALPAHWSYRHAFWLAYLERGAISDAWLALGGKVYGSAQATRELGGAYARLRGLGVQPDHSALLLRIGPLVIVEFSHLGKLRAWLANQQDAPELGCPQYDSRAFRCACLAFPSDPQTGQGGNASGQGLPHKGSARGYWQKSAATLIQRHAGIRIAPSDWQPR